MYKKLHIPIKPLINVIIWNTKKFKYSPSSIKITLGMIKPCKWQYSQIHSIRHMPPFRHMLGNAYQSLYQLKRYQHTQIINAHPSPRKKNEHWITRLRKYTLTNIMPYFPSNSFSFLIPLDTKVESYCSICYLN